MAQSRSQQQRNSLFGRGVEQRLEQDHERDQAFDVPPHDADYVERRPSPEFVNWRSDVTHHLSNEYISELAENELVRESEYVEWYMVPGTSKDNTRQRRVLREQYLQPKLDVVPPDEKPAVIQEKAELDIRQAYADLYFFRREVEGELAAFYFTLHQDVVLDGSKEKLKEKLEQIASLEKVTNKFEQYTESAMRLVVDYAETYKNDGAFEFIEEMNSELFLAIGKKQSDLPEHYHGVQTFRWYLTQMGKQISFTLIKEIIETRLQTITRNPNYIFSVEDNLMIEEKVTEFETRNGDQVLTLRVEEISERAA